MSKILVTGCNGFIGKYVVKELEKTSHNIIETDKNKLFLQKSIDVKACLSHIMPDVVIHTAGLAHLGQCNNSPIEAVEVNIFGTANLLQACRICRAKRIIYISSSYVFSKEGGIYKVCKKACEDLIREYYNLYSLNYTIIRCGTVYGVGSDENNGIYNLVQKAKKSELDNINSPGTNSYFNSVREYIHVTDIAKGIVKSLEDKYINKELLLSGTQTKTEEEIIDMLKEMVIDKRNKNGHYNKIPYSYQPIQNEKLTLDSYKDLGAGLLEMMENE